jgi:hypothetical protein
MEIFYNYTDQDFIPCSMPTAVLMIFVTRKSLSIVIFTTVKRNTNLEVIMLLKERFKYQEISKFSNSPGMKHE